MKLFKGLSKHDLLYGGLISTFVVLYGATAFVSWYHAITFFNIANAMWLSVILSFVAEIGQASVLFSILLTELKKTSHIILSWTIMTLLTTLQVIGNVVSSYEWITTHGGAGVEAFQKSILFWMAAADPEIFKVVIAWITGALLPIIALSMTALVAQYMELKAENVKTHLDVDKPKPEPIPVPTIEPIPADVVMSEVSKIRLTDEEMENLSELLSKKKPIEKVPSEEDGVRGGYGNMGIPTEEKKTSEEPIQFKSPGIFTTEKLINHSPSIEEILADLSPEAKQYMREKLDEEQASEIISATWGEEQQQMLDEQERSNRPDTSDEIHEEWSKMYDDIHKVLQEEVPPPENIISDEEINFLDEEEIKKVVSEVGDPPIIVTHQSGLVDGILGSQPVEIPNSEIYDETGESIGIKGESEPLTETTPDEEEKKKQEEARVEKLRQIARDNLKKK